MASLYKLVYTFKVSINNLPWLEEISFLKKKLIALRLLFNLNHALHGRAALPVDDNCKTCKKK